MYYLRRADLRSASHGARGKRCLNEFRVPALLTQGPAHGRHQVPYARMGFSLD